MNDAERDSKTPHRRDFLTGKAAVDAVQKLVGDALPEPAASQPASSPRSCLIEIGRNAMASEFQVLVPAESEADTMERAIESLDIVERIEDQLSAFRPNSEISRVNREASIRPVGVDAELFDLLELCVKLHLQTGGAFDITASPLWRLWGFHRRSGTFPGVDLVDRTRSSVGSQHLELSASQRTVRFTIPAMEINLGAIGKGYALDRCASFLDAGGVKDYLIHGGQSSICVRGNRDASRAPGWRVAIRDPIRPNQTVGEVWLIDRALGTSGSANQFFYHQGRRLSHILDPRTGWPAEGILSATVLAPTATIADALSTAFFVMGVEKTVEYCEQHPELGALLLLPGKRAGELERIAIGIHERTDGWTCGVRGERGRESFSASNCLDSIETPTPKKTPDPFTPESD